MAAHLSIKASQVFGSLQRPIVVVDHTHMASPKGMLELLPGRYSYDHSKASHCHKLLCDVIDSLGKASAQSQGLPGPITSAVKMAGSHDQRLYLLIDSSIDQIVGLLKVGKKKLFINDPRKNGQFDSALVECLPFCILDFYVAEGQQRRGHGRRIFDEMLSTEGISVAHIAVDRPSPKMISFLNRHYKLTNPHTQRNNYTIFDSFFTPGNPAFANSNNGRRSSAYRQDLKKSFSTENLANTRQNYAAAPLKPRDFYAQQHNQQLPRQLPPLPGMGGGRSQYNVPSSADIVNKNRFEQQQNLEQQLHQLPRSASNTQVHHETPPKLQRDQIPDSYRALFANKPVVQMPLQQNRHQELPQRPSPFSASRTAPYATHFDHHHQQQQQQQQQYQRQHHYQQRRYYKPF